MSDYFDPLEPPPYSLWDDLTGALRQKKQEWNRFDDARNARAKEANRRVYLQGYLRRDPGVYAQWDEKDRSLLPPELRQRFDSLEEQNNLGTPSPFRLPISAQAPAQPRSDFASGEGGGGDFDVAQPRSPLLEALAKPDAQNQTPVSKPASTPVTISPAMMPRIGTNLGSDEDLTTRIPLLQSLTQPTREHFIFGPQSNSLVKPMFSGQGDMADRRLNVLDRTDPAAAAALRQQLATTQAKHNVEMEYNRLHDQARTPVHYGSEPMAAADVAGLVAKQKEQEYLTGNPGMRRFLGGQPVQDAPAKFALMDSLTENVREDNGKTYGTVGGRNAVKNEQGNWAIQPRSRGSLNPQEQAEWIRTHTPEHKQMLADNAKSYPAKVAARAQAKQHAHMQHMAKRPQAQAPIAPMNPYAITAEQADRLMAMYGPDKATPIINNAAARALAWDQQQAQSHTDMAKMANDRGIAEMQIQARAKEEENKLAAQRDAMKNEHSMAEMRERTQRQINDPAMKAAETRLAIAMQSGDPVQMAQAQRDYSAVTNSNRGGVPSPPIPAPEMPLPTPSSEQITKALNDVTNNYPGAQSDPAQAAQAREFLKQQGVRPTDLQDYRNSDNGDPSWYEWWDKYVYPAISTDAGNEINRRRRNVPLLDSLLSGTRR